MISRKLMHQVANRLQVVLGYIDLGEIEKDAAKRTNLFEKARTEIRQLNDLLNSRIRQSEPNRKKK